MAQFKHPNVVKLYGIISRIDPIMIIMEYMDNGSLDRYLQVRGERGRRERGRRERGRERREGRGERGEEKEKEVFYLRISFPTLYKKHLDKLGSQRQLNISYGVAVGMSYLSKIGFVHRVRDKGEEGGGEGRRRREGEEGGRGRREGTGPDSIILYSTLSLRIWLPGISLSLRKKQPKWLTSGLPGKWSRMNMESRGCVDCCHAHY